MNPFEEHRAGAEALLRLIPGADNGAPLFAAPWQARIFSLAAALIRQGHLSPDDLLPPPPRATANGADKIDNPHDDIWEGWLDAVENSLKKRGLLTRKETGPEFSGPAATDRE